ncbi:MAG: EI24 domain-containing protein [Persicimonas sp.]
MHPLLEDLEDALERSKMGQVTSGLGLPFRAARFLTKNTKLVPFVIIPAVINALLFGLSAFFLVSHAGDLVEWLWQKPGADAFLEYLLVALWYVFYALSIILALVVSYFVVLLAGGIVASPFHDLLSEHTERILRGTDELPESDASFVADTLRSLGSSAGIALLYLVIIAPVMLLNLIPGAGNMAATIIGTGVSAFFVSLEYTDPTLERHQVPLKKKLRLIREHLPLTGGFGLGASLLLWVPLLNFLCMPIAVIGGTALAMVLAPDE